MGQGEADAQQDDDEWDPEEPLFEEGQEISDDSEAARAWLEELEGSSGVEGERAERDQQRPAEAEGRQPDERRTKTRRLKRKRRGQRDQAGRAAARPTQMSYAELDQNRREGHVNYHPGCAHCVAARALADRHERDLKGAIDKSMLLTAQQD